MALFLIVSNKVKVVLADYLERDSDLAWIFNRLSILNGKLVIEFFVLWNTTRYLYLKSGCHLIR